MKKISEKLLYEGNWIALKESVYENVMGETSKWESVVRKKSNLVVIIIAKLVPSNKFILIKQFRQPIDNYIIGFPAGIVSSKDPESDAVRELKEETGYSGRVVAKTPILKANVGLTGDDVIIMTVDVDETSTENKNPVQNLEPAEEIEVVVKKKEDIKEYLLSEKEKGIDVGAGLWYYFM